MFNKEMDNNTLCALCTANLNLTVKRRGDYFEVRRWYMTDDGHEDYMVDFSGDWDSCMAYMKSEWDAFNLRLMDI